MSSQSTGFSIYFEPEATNLWNSSTNIITLSSSFSLLTSVVTRNTTAYLITLDTGRLTCSAAGISNIPISFSKSNYQSRKLRKSISIQLDRMIYNADVSVYDPLGRIIKQVKNVSGQVITLHLDHVAKGLCIIQLTQIGKAIAIESFISSD